MRYDADRGRRRAGTLDAAAIAPNSTDAGCRTLRVPHDCIRMLLHGGRDDSIERSLSAGRRSIRPDGHRPAAVPGRAGRPHDAERVGSGGSDAVRFAAARRLAAGIPSTLARSPASGARSRPTQVTGRRPAPEKMPPPPSASRRVGDHGIHHACGPADNQDIPSAEGARAASNVSVVKDENFRDTERSWRPEPTSMRERSGKRLKRRLFSQVQTESRPPIPAYLPSQGSRVFK